MTRSRGDPPRATPTPGSAGPCRGVGRASAHGGPVRQGGADGPPRGLDGVPGVQGPPLCWGSGLVTQTPVMPSLKETTTWSLEGPGPT